MDICSQVLYIQSGVILAWLVFCCIVCVCRCQGKLIIRRVSRTKICPQSNNYQSIRTSEYCEHALKRQAVEQELVHVKSRFETLNKQLELVEREREDAFGRIGTLTSKLKSEREERENARKRLATLISTLETERVEKEEALKRLSSIMSSRLRDGNPNVADLSDQNRPVKIGEQFSELYDNQWTNAYDAVEKHLGPGVRENDIIKLLLDILEQCFMLCKEQGEKQLSLIRENVSRIATLITKKATHLPEDLMQRIKEERKIFAKEELPSYDKALLQIKEIISIPTDVLDSRALNEFVNECLKICWLMLVQDPPMTMILKHERNENDKFKAYKTRGNDVAFVVWPALLLQEGGAVLQKGVAEFCDSTHF